MACVPRRSRSSSTFRSSSLFQAASSAVQAVEKATLTRADMVGRVITFDTPMGMMSWGENIIVGFIPGEGNTVVEITCKDEAACPTSCRTAKIVR